MSGDCEAGAVRLWLSVGLRNAADCGAAAGAVGGADAAREPAAESAAAADAIMTASRAAVCTSSTIDFAAAVLDPGNCMQPLPQVRRVACSTKRHVFKSAPIQITFQGKGM